MNLRLALIAFFAVAGGRLGSGQEAPLAAFGTTVVNPAGLRGLIYLLPKNANELPDFEALKPSGTVYTPSLQVRPQNFKRGFPGITRHYEWFAIDYRGNFWIEQPGLYQFALESDDGSKLYIDDQLILDSDGQHPPLTRSASMRLGYGAHGARVSYFQGPRYHVALRLWIGAPGGPMKIFSTEEYRPPANPENWRAPELPARTTAPEPLRAASPTPRFETTVFAPAGLTGRVFRITPGTSQLPDFAGLPEVATPAGPSFDMLPQDREPFAMDAGGNFWVEEPGLYRFSLAAEDGARLFVDDQLIADHDAPHVPRDRRRQAHLRLTYGPHMIRMLYYHASKATASLDLWIAGPGKEFRVFSTNEFRRR